jgi:hypothetical protein
MCEGYIPEMIMNSEIHEYGHERSLYVSGGRVLACAGANCMCLSVPVLLFYSCFSSAFIAYIFLPKQSVVFSPNHII